MSNQPKKDMIPYGKAERQAEVEIDCFLHSVNATPALTILRQLQELS